MTSRRFAFGWLVCLLAALGFGCAVEPPYPPWTAPPAPSPLSIPEVMQLVRAGVPEEAILAMIRSDGISAFPTTPDLLELRGAGASESLIARLLASALPDPAECPPKPTIEYQFILWQPFAPLPGFLPIPGWHWLEGGGRTVPRPEGIEP